MVSFHDLHPQTRGLCARFIEDVRALGVGRISILVVPRWHGARPISRDRACCDWLRGLAAEGHDLCLHGFFHRADAVSGGPLRQAVGRLYTRREGEFFQIDHATALDRLRRGLTILAEQARLPVAGFTPPAWLMSGPGREAVRQCGFHYTTTFSRIELLRHGRTIAAPTITYSSRRAWRRAASLGWARVWEAARRETEVLRIAAHPGDFAHPRIAASLHARIRSAVEAGREAVTYRELAESGVQPIETPPVSVA